MKALVIANGRLPIGSVITNQAALKLGDHGGKDSQNST
jgi:hypothetical protein